ncbi:MAG: hypothetical protein ACT4OD_02540 [Candidatus Nitrosotenuis sp.]
MDLTDLREKLVVLGFTASIFLPIRLIVGEYLFDNWFGMLGIASLISVILIILVKKEKLGKLGQIFKKQMTKSLWGKPIKAIILILVLFSAYFGTTILLIDKGNSEYHHDKEIIAKNFADKRFDRGTVSKLVGPQIQDHSIIGFTQIQYLEYALAISYAILNDSVGGWLVNLHLILFIEQIEILGLLWFYRQTFKPKIIA